MLASASTTLAQLFLHGLDFGRSALTDCEKAVKVQTLGRFVIGAFFAAQFEPEPLFYSAEHLLGARHSRCRS